MITQNCRYRSSNVWQLGHWELLLFKNTQNHNLTPIWTLVTLDHMTVLFENVSLPHALLVPKKSNVLDLVTRNYCFFKTPKITFWPLSDLYWPWITWPFCLKLFPYHMHFLSQRNQMCWILSLGVIAFLKMPKITLWPLSHLYWPWITWPFCLKMFPYHMHFLSHKN